MDNLSLLKFYTSINKMLDDREVDLFTDMGVDSLDFKQRKEEIAYVRRQITNILHKELENLAVMEHTKDGE